MVDDFDVNIHGYIRAHINNIEVPFLHINQLIDNKKAVNRSTDQLDVIELKKIKELRRETGLDQ